MCIVSYIHRKNYSALKFSKQLSMDVKISQIKYLIVCFLKKSLKSLKKEFKAFSK